MDIDLDDQEFDIADILPGSPDNDSTVVDVSYSERFFEDLELSLLSESQEGQPETERAPAQLPAASGQQKLFSSANRESWKTAQEDLVVPEEIRRNSQNFRLPVELANGYLVHTAESRSLIYIFGKVILPKPGSGEKKRFWKCLFDSCRTKKLFALAEQSTGNVTKHLRNQHGVESLKTDKTRRNKAARKRRAKANMSFKTQDPQRFYRLQVTRMIVGAALPISFCKNNILCELINDINFPKLYPEAVKKTALEMYSCVKNRIKRELGGIKKKFHAPSFHLCVDVYMNELQSVKYLGLRVSFTDIRVQSEAARSVFNPFQGYNLAVRVFNPSSRERESKRLSRLLANWTERVLQEYGLTAADFVTATSDAGSDVKRLLETCLKIPREWCVAHILNCALVEAFSKLPSAQQLIKEMKRVVNHVKRSPNALTCLRDAQRKEGFQSKPTLFAYQRWASSSKMFDFFRKHDDTLRTYFSDSKKRPFKWPGAIDNVVVEEVSSLLKLVNRTLKMAQNDKVFCVNPIVSLMDFYYLLQPEKELPILEVFSGKVEECRKFHELDEVTQLIISRLRAGLDKRFFDRFHPILSLKKAYRSSFKRLGRKFSFTVDRMRFSCLFEICHFLCPKYRNGKLIRKLIEKRMKGIDNKIIPKGLNQKELEDLHFRNLQQIVRDQIMNYAKRHLSGSAVFDLASKKQDSHRRKDAKETFSPTNFSDDAFSVEGLDSAADVPFSIEQKINDEINTYLGTPSAQLLKDVQGTHPVYEFWRKEYVGARFPFLAKVALAFLSTKASSAAIERDFSPISDILVRKRSNLKPWMLEILLALKLNMDVLPLDLSKIPTLSKDTLEACHRFKERHQEEEEILTGMYSEAEHGTVEGDGECSITSSKRVSDSDKGTDTEVEDEYCDVSVSDISSEDVEQSIAKKRMASNRAEDVLDVAKKITGEVILRSSSRITKQRKARQSRATKALKVAGKRVEDILDVAKKRDRGNSSPKTPERACRTAQKEMSSSSSDNQRKIKKSRALKALEIGGQPSPLLGKRRSSATEGTHARTMKKVRHKVPQPQGEYKNRYNEKR